MKDKKQKQDQEILQLLEHRAESALGQLARAYGGYCFAIAKNILQNHEDSEECVNDCYLGVWNAIPPTIPKSLMAYVARLTRNIAIKKYHHNSAQKRNSVYDLSFEELKEVVAAVDTPEHQVMAQEMTQYLNEFLSSLEEENQILFILRYWYNDSVEEIGKKRKLKANTVAVRLKRLRDKLKKFLEEKGYDHD